MKTSAKERRVEHPGVIANRYRVEMTLGQGGMGVVYQVYDTSTDRHFALKQLSATGNPEKQRRILKLFEREFHTLSHLSHPRVVEVYDYGKDDAGPYYTMELLDGGDLNRLSPLPWTTACALLCDICSALSLLHSRRLVHRDLTPRNVRCTQDKKAKLIDFGTMIPMGPCKHAVGTPPFVAPEAFNAQVVDARTDLFSLGATAYYALTRRHAYAGARSFATLRDAWRTQPSPPSRHVPEIPKGLDDLVMSLIHLDPMARPASAAEVMERLSAIADLKIDERLVVRQAYLSAPTLVGRDELLLRVRKQMVRALRNRGGTVMITGASGVGRSRFLDACVLEGKLAGAAVLRADATDASRGDWGAAQALAQQLVEALPHAALQAARPRAPVLGHVLPNLLDGFELKTFGNPQELRPQVQAAFRDWLLELSKQRCLMVAVDDVDRMDEPSAALVALMSDQAAEHRLVVAATAETDAPATSERALSLLSEAGARLKLRNLSPGDTEKLLCSVFGEVPNIRLLADRIHVIANGNPRAVMQLAQHVLDKGLVRYDAGAWILPDSIGTDDLPHTLGEALKTRVGKLRSSALAFAQAVALCAKPGFSFDDCLALSLHGDRATLIEDLEQLVALEILSTDGERYALRQAGWRPVLADELTGKHARTLHLRVAELLQQHEGEETRVACHLLQANEPERALNLLIDHAKAIIERSALDPTLLPTHIRSLPDNWLSIYESLIAVCKELGRPRKELFILQRLLVSVDSLKAQAERTHLNQVIQQLHRDSGLDLYEEQDDVMDAPTRLGRALQLAQQRFDGTPESERVLPPAEAIPQLARVIVQAIGAVGGANDYAFLESLPSLEPLVSLSPALAVVEKNRQSTAHVNAGRIEQARQGWLEVIDRVNQPDGAGLQGVAHTYMRLAVIYAVGAIEIHAGVPSAVKWIDELEKDPLFEVNAWRLRMLLALRQGDFSRAELCKKHVELLQIQNSPTQFFEGRLAWTEAVCYATSDDLARLKQTIPALEEMAARYPGWVPCLHYARGEYQRIRGDWHSALALFEQALALTAPGRHLSWTSIVGSQISALLALGRLKQAKAVALEALASARREHLAAIASYIRKPLALVYAALGEFDNAIASVQAVIDDLEALGTTGMVLGELYETRARIAIAMNDPEGLKIYARLCADQYQAGRNPALTAKYEKLMLEARRANLLSKFEMGRESELGDESEQTMHTLATSLGSCRGPRERAKRTLELFLQQSSCLGGMLYTMQQRGPVLAAQTGDRRPPVNIDSLVAAYLSAELDEAQDVTVTEVDRAEGPVADGAWTGPDGDRFVPLVLAHESDAGFAVTGMIVLCVDPAKQLLIPSRLLPLLSQSLQEAGDVATATAAS